MGEVIRVALIDDDALVVSALARVLVDEGLEVASVSTSVATGLERVKALRPDVVVCDVMLEGHPTGLELPTRLGTIGLADTPVLLLSSFGTDYLVGVARRSGAVGYVTKHADPGALASAIKVVAAGEQVFPPVRIPDTAGPTPTQLALIRAVADGLSTTEAAARLSMSTRTVDAHLRTLFERYGVVSRTQLVVVAIRNGWITELPFGGASRSPRRSPSAGG